MLNERICKTNSLLHLVTESILPQKNELFFNKLYDFLEFEQNDDGISNKNACFFDCNLFEENLIYDLKSDTLLEKDYVIIPLFNRAEFEIVIFSKIRLLLSHSDNTKIVWNDREDNKYAIYSLCSNKSSNAKELYEKLRIFVQKYTNSNFQNGKYTKLIDFNENYFEHKIVKIESDKHSLLSEEVALELIKTLLKQSNISHFLKNVTITDKTTFSLDELKTGKFINYHNLQASNNLETIHPSNVMNPESKNLLNKNLTFSLINEVN